MKHNRGVKAVIRRKAVIERLNAQIDSGYKNTKEGKIPLDEKDLVRIQKELITLSSRL